MKIFCKLFSGWLLLTAILLPGAELPDPAFRLGNRDFSRAEAILLAGGESDPERARALIQNNFAAAATIVVCSRSGIELSAESTQKTLQESLLLMSPEARKKFLQQLSDNDISPEEWQLRQARRLENQLNDAVRRWYVKNYAARRRISQEHIQAWYYRNMNIFRRTEVKSDFIWVFAPQDTARLEQALAALRQGAAPDAVRKEFALPVNIADLLEDLQKNSRRRTPAAPGYEIIKSERCLYLLKADALQHFYLPLDEKLQLAIGNALYDALAKATLAEVLKKEFPHGGIKFY